MKNVLLALSLFAIASPAMAKSPKLVITYTASGKKADDCKISKKEIAKIIEKKEDKSLCTKIKAASPDKEELTPESLAKLVSLDKEQQGKLALAFTGTDGADLVKTLTAWTDYLVSQNRTANWTISLVSAENNVATVQFENANGETFSIQVILGFEIPKDKNKKEDDKE